MRRSIRNSTHHVLGFLFWLLWLSLVTSLPAWAAVGSCSNATYNYQGYGATNGGADQTVFTVTSSANSGPGSLRALVGSNACIQFSSSMTITLNSSLDLSGLSNLTIDGLSAPSPGITLAHCGIYAQGPDAHDIIIRGLRIRMDNSSEGNCVTEGDGIGLLGPIGQGGPHHWIIDRNSIAGAVDENLGLAYYVGYAAHDLTVSRNFFTDPTQIGPNRVNIVISGGVQRVSFHHNLMADGTRLPASGYDDGGATSPDVMADVRNNISWMNDEGSKYTTGSKANSIGNYFIKASSMSQTTFEQRAIGLEDPERTQLYTSNNDSDPPISGLNSRGNMGSPFTAGVPAVTTTSALQGACDVVSQSGVFPRDAHDLNVLSRFSLSGCPTGVNFTFAASSPVPTGTPSTLTWSAVTGATSCTASMVTGSDANWTGTSSSQLLAGGTKSGVNLTANATYRMSCTNGVTPLTIDRLVTISIPPSSNVHHVRQGGNDANDCTSALTNDDAHAKQSVGNATRTCGGPGKTIQVHEGVYDEAFDNARFYRNGSFVTGTFPGGTSDSNRFTIEGATGEQVELRPSQDYGGGVIYNDLVSWVTLRRLILDGRNQTGSPLKIHNQTHWRIEDLEARNGGQLGTSCGAGVQAGSAAGCPGSCFHEFIRVNSHHNCPISNPPGHGAYLSCSDNTFTGGEYHHNPGHGIQSYCDPGGSGYLGDAHRNKFYGVKLYNNPSTGLGLYNGTGLEAVNCLAYQNGTGIRVNNNTAKMYGNTAEGNTDAGLSCMGGINADIKNNLSVNNGGSEFEDCTNVAGNGNIASNNPDDFFVSASGHDYHIKSGSTAINAGVNLPDVPPNRTDIEGRTRPLNEVTTGAYQVGGVVEPPQPDPFLIVAKYPADEGSGLSVADVTGGGHICSLNTAGWVTPGIVGTAGLSLNGARWCEATGDSALRPANEFCISGWFKSNTPQACDLVSMGDAYAARVNIEGTIAGFFYTGSSWVGATSSVSNMTDGSPHHFVASKDLTGVKTWVDRAQGPLFPTTSPISYTLAPNLQIGRHGNGDTGFNCTGVLDMIYVMRGHCTQEAVDQLYAEQVSVPGTSMTHSQFERANAAIGNVLATDADLPAHDRSQAVALAVAIQRTGTTTDQYYGLECSRNGGAFTTVTNLFSSLGIRIAPDSVLNMGDSVPVTLPTGGFTGVAGRVVANTINTGITTPLSNGQQTQWRYTLDFGGPANANDTYDCRPEGFGSTNYFNVKRITLVDPPLGTTLKGSTFRGITVR